MIIDTETNKTTISSKAIGSKMSVNLNGTSFKFILDNLYTHPHRAIVRELSCNAVDAHVLADNYEPFHIQVPNKFNSVFIIRDFGTGLDDNEIEQYLNTLYSSSKIESNEQIGGFGLGSKSPFSLVQSFFISSYKNGKVYNCFWYRDSEGIPVLKIQSIKDTEERNGIKYTVTFETKDVQAIAHACVTELFGLKIKPRFFSDINDPSTEFSTFDQSNLSIVEDTETFTFYNDPNCVLKNQFGVDCGYHFQRSRFLGLSVGGVMYPIPSNINIESDLNSITPQLTLRTLHSMLNPSSFISVKLPIGSVKLPSTREHILSTSENRSIIIPAIKKALWEYTLKIKEEFKEEFVDKNLQDTDIILKDYREFISRKSLKLDDSTYNLLADFDSSQLTASGPIKKVLDNSANTSFYIRNLSGLLSESYTYKVITPVNNVTSLNTKSFFTYRPIDLSRLRVSNSQYSSHNSIRSLSSRNNNSKILIIYHNCNKFMTAYLGGMDLSSYKIVYRCDAFYGAGSHPNIDYKDLEELLKYFVDQFKDNTEITVLCSSDLVKPTTSVQKAVVQSTYSGIRSFYSINYINSGYDAAYSFNRKYDSDLKSLSFNEEYIDIANNPKGIGYCISPVENGSTIRQYVIDYFNYLGIKSIYIAKSPKYIQELKDGLSNLTIPVYEISNDLKIDLSQYFSKEYMYQLLYLCTLLISGGNNINSLIFTKKHREGFFSELSQDALNTIIERNIRSNIPHNLLQIILPSDKRAFVGYIGSHFQSLVEEYQIDNNQDLNDFTSDEILEAIKDNVDVSIFKMIQNILQRT